MNKLAEPFDQGAADFGEWAKTPWGRLYTEILWQQIEWHLARPGQRVLDAGCGLGQLAIRLAQAGHEVAALDFAEGMIASAQENAVRAGATVEWRQLAVEDAAGVFPPESFDLVLCHSVLSYVRDPAAVVRDLAGLLRPGGILSLVGANPRAQALHTAIWKHDFGAALAQLERPAKYSSAFDLDLELHGVDTVTGWVDAAGLERVARYGVRVVNDLITDNAVKGDPDKLAALLKLELALGSRDPYREIAAYTHLVATNSV